MTPLIKKNIELIKSALRYLHTRIKGLKIFFMILVLAIILFVGWLQNLLTVLLGDIVNVVVQEQEKL